MKWEDIVRTINVLIALSIGYFCQVTLGLEHGLWLYITIIVVLAPADDFEKAFKKAKYRAIGTCIGGVTSLLAYFVLYEWDSLISYYTIICTGFVLGIYNASKKYPYAATLTSLTIFIANYERFYVLDVALWRLGNVLLGCFIAYLISLFSRMYFKRREVE